ncbi:hypothetical protein CVU37_10430 [candidate division BRC1 bacterium HGW-BRC1-1]|jgi:hypothetical protein|nr:MAG: hypothetical protein CVU37_10430 [candidate division BRC1 bacterium HGW-BRC1-1]
MKSLRFNLIRFAALLLLPVVPQAAGAAPVASPTQREVLRNDGISVIVGGDQFLSINVDGVPFSYQSSLVAVNPGWKGTLYYARSDYRMISRSKFERSAGASEDGPCTATLDLTDPEGRFSATMVLTLEEGRRLRMATEMTMKNADGGEYEFQMAAPLGGWMAGRPFTARTDAGTSTGVLPAMPWTDDLEGSKLFRNLRELKVDGRGTSFSVAVDGKVNVSLLDYRLNRWADNQSVYYMGALRTPMKKDERITATVTFDFGERLSQARGVVKADAGVKESKELLGVEEPVDRVIPTPKKITWGEGTMPLSTPLTVWVNLPEAEAAAKFWAKRAQEEFGVSAEVKLSKAYDRMMPPTGVAVLFRPYLELPPEGYQITVQEKLARAEAATTEGLHNAVQTLMQLMRVSEDGKTVGVRRAEVEDWPVLGYRGVHFYIAKDGVAFQKRLLSTILGPLKINQLLYQCEYLLWKSHPELAHPTYAMSQDDARQVLAEARAQGIEVTPIINSFGHSHWIYQNGHHLDLADNPEKPRTFNPTKPEVYRLVEDIYAEAIELFKPRIFHVGKDEIDQYGFPESDEARKQTTTEWMRRDILHWHDFMTKRGIRTAVWSDMFLAPSEASSAASALNTSESKARRGNLPDDVLVYDWHYVPVKPEKYISLPVWLNEGLDTIVAPWSQPANVVTIAKAAANARAAGADGTTTQGKAMGLLQTTWAGYQTDEPAFLAAQKQFTAYLLAAEAAWTGGYNSADEVPFDYAEEFTRIWMRNDLPQRGAQGWTLGLGDVAKFDVGNDANARWLGYDGGATPGKLPVGQVRMGRILFDVAGEAGHPKCLLMAGGFNPQGTQWPARAEIAVGKKAGMLALLVAATQPAPPIATLGTATVHFADDTTESITWKLGETIFPLEDNTSLVTTQRSWTSPGAEGRGDKPFHLHTCLWRNPRPAKVIESIEIVSSNQGPAVMLFGVSGIEATSQPEAVKTTSKKSRKP